MCRTQTHACWQALLALTLLPTSILVLSLKVDAFPITIMFGMCSIFLFVASILQRRLMAISDKPSTYKFYTTILPLKSKLEFSKAKFTDFVQPASTRNILHFPAVVSCIFVAVLFSNIWCFFFFIKNFQRWKVGQQWTLRLSHWMIEWCWAGRRPLRILSRLKKNTGNFIPYTVATDGGL